MTGDEGGNNILYRLGELSGKLDGVLNQVGSLNSSLISHIAEDSRHFNQLHKDMDDLRNKQMYWSGGVAVLVALLMMGGQLLLGKLI